jgi:hypothetical protein
MPHACPLLTSITATETSIPFPLLSRVHATNASAAWESRSRLRPQGRYNLLETLDFFWLRGKGGKLFWLVVDLPLWKICKSVGMMTFPINIWEHKKIFQTTNQSWVETYVNGCEWCVLVVVTLFGKHQICYSTSSGFPFLKTFTLWYAFNTYSPFWRNHEILKPKSTHSYLPSPALPKAKPRRGEVKSTSTVFGFGLPRGGLSMVQIFPTTHENIITSMVSIELLN